jgi:hypothetical protein
MGLNSITLQSNDSDVISGDIVGRINWAAASDGDGPVATSIAASIFAVAEETFNDSNNATSLIFSTANDSNASEKLKITSGGHLLPVADASYDLGSDNFYFRSIYADKYYGDIDGPIVVECRNDTGSTISKGSPVYISGYYSNNGKPQIAPSDAASASTMPAIGILANELTDGSEGHVHCFGLVTQINTSSFSVGDTVYVANGGGLTNSRPTGATDLVQNIGRVLRSDTSQGRILVLGPGRTNDTPNSLDVTGTITASNIGPGEDDSVVVLDSDGKLRTDEIDSRVWGTSLVDGNGTSNYLSKWSDSDTLTSGIIYDDGTNVGIGTPSPATKLHIKSDTNSSYGNLFIEDTTSMAAGVGGSIVFGGAYTTAGATARYGIISAIKENSTSSDSKSAMVFYTNDAVGAFMEERMRITSGGNVGIATANPNYKLDVNGTFSANSINVNDEYTFPTVDGTANQILKTDGNGNLSWIDSSSSGSGAALSIKSTGTQIGDSDIEVLDFSNDFEITETPDKEINISLKNNYINGSFDLTTTTSSFTVTDGYTVGTLNVYQNGIKLYSGEDFTATNGTSFTLTNAAVSGDVVEYWGINYASLTPANTSFGSITATGSQTLFSTSGYTVGGLVVFVNGVKQNSSEFTATNGTSFTLTSAASSGDIVEYIAYSTTIASTNLQKTGDTMTGNLTVDADLIVKGYKETFLDNGNTGTTQTISISSSTLQAYTLTGNCIFTMPSPDAGRSFVMFLKTGTGSYTASFTDVKFPKNSSPTITTTANRMDLLSFYSDGTYWYANINQEYHI